MDTRWGLDLDMSAVRLLRLDDDEWGEIAVEKIDGPDIEDRLKKMVEAIDAGSPVEIFLPRDQILYMAVDLQPGDPVSQIERALDGRTPYALDELSFDWEETAPSKAQVAAIALDTLDEAAAFAEVRGLAISGYSSLDTDGEFPRLPKFAGPMIAEPAPQPAPAFASARKPSRPPQSPTPAATATMKSRITPVAGPAAATARAEPEQAAPKPVAEPALRIEDLAPSPTSGIAPVAEPVAVKAKTERAPPKLASEPVLRIDDATPVMKVKAPSVPLDPGIPIAAPNAPPRVRTDIAASSVSRTVASLTPPKPVRIRQQGSPFLSVAAVFAVVAVLTVGIAVLVWHLLPMRPGAPAAMPPAAESTGATPAGPESRAAEAPPARPDAPIEQAAAPEAEPEAPVEEATAPEPTPEERPEPAPVLQAEVALLSAPEPEPETVPELVALTPAVERRASPEPLFRALRDGGRRPSYDPTVPDPATPEALAGILTAAPSPGPAPEIETRIDDLYVASIEPANLSFDAIALPDARQFAADPVPQLDAPAEPFPPDVDPDAVAAALNDALVGPGGLIQTELARSLTDRAPRSRPGGFVAEIERQQFGGRTREELSGFRPPARPASAQVEALAEAPEAAPASELAVATSLLPRGRPGDFAENVAQTLARIEADRVTASASYQVPDTSSAIEAALETDVEPEPRPEEPRRLSIPTSASVARQATLEDAIQLNRVNLVGVYGAPSDRRALVRLPSGRFIKVKVGDRIDGGTVAQITDSSLQYRKGSRMVSLEIPQG